MVDRVQRKYNGSTDVTHTYIRRTFLQVCWSYIFSEMRKMLLLADFISAFHRKVDDDIMSRLDLLGVGRGRSSRIADRGLAQVRHAHSTSPKRAHLSRNTSDWGHLNVLIR